MNAMVHLIVRLEKELEMQREGRALPIRNDFVAIKSKPKRQPKKKDREQTVSPIRQSATCNCPASSD